MIEHGRERDCNDERDRKLRRLENMAGDGQGETESKENIKEENNKYRAKEDKLSVGNCKTL